MEFWDFLDYFFYEFDDVVDDEDVSFVYFLFCVVSDDIF